MTAAVEVHRLASWVKWRLYRFSDCLEAHVCAEEVEERVRTGRRLPDVVVREVAKFIERHGSDGDVRFDAHTVAAGLGIDPRNEIAKRLAGPGASAIDGPVVILTGPPRSGSSDVLNRLVHTTTWTTFTDHSHHLWSPFNLVQASSRFLTLMPMAHLAEDTTKGRLDPSVSWPSEGEQIFHRAIPVASLARSHVYDLHAAETRDVAMLHRVVAEHRPHFSSEVLVSKSPFHALRLELFDRLWARPVVVLVDRAAGQAAASMERQRFQFRIDGKVLRPVEAEQMFRRLAVDRADVIVDHDNVRRDPARAIARLRDAIERRF